MPMTWNEAVAALTGPGAPFEIIEAEVGGQTTRVYKNTPRSLRALFDTARARGDATFLVYEDERWSFAETMARVDALGAALAARGVRPGDRVAIAMRNYPEWVVAFAAITSIGAISVSLNAWWNVQDRAKDMVLRAGENVYCAEVEAALYEHPDVYEAAVFGIPHERLGEEVAAAIVPKPGRTPETDAPKSFLAQHLAPFKIPSRIENLSEPLPRNPPQEPEAHAARRDRGGGRQSAERNVMRRFSSAASGALFGTRGRVSPYGAASSRSAGMPRFTSS